jgi:hypothetical protein
MPKIEIQAGGEMMTLKMSVNSMMVLSPQQGFVHT